MRKSLSLIRGLANVRNSLDFTVLDHVEMEVDEYLAEKHTVTRE